jgi:hypothetical protein
LIRLRPMADDGPRTGRAEMSLGKWVGVLLAVMVACAVVGFLIDALRFVAGAAFVVCLLVLIGRMVMGKRA